jgi:hypothetical protein
MGDLMIGTIFCASKHQKYQKLSRRTRKVDQTSTKENTAMLVDVELRERLSTFCALTKQTQEQAGNQAIREMLERVESDPVTKQRLDRITELQELLRSV